MRRSILLAVLAIIAALAAACAQPAAVDLGPIPAGATSAAPASPSPDDATPPDSPDRTPASSDETMTFEVWFAYGGSLFVTHRTVPSSPRIGSAAVTALLEGPDATERRAGVGTAVPDGARLLGLTIEDGIASVDLSGEFGSGGGRPALGMRLAQLTYTLTQFPTVRGVVLLLDGRRVDTFSGQGLIVDRPLTRERFSEFLPAILVETPAPGDRVSSPVTISGTADVFEATVSISLLDASGREIVRTFTTATCGTGCRGTYSAAVRFHVARTQEGIVRVYESSAKDGSAINVVDIPVTLGA